MAGTLPLGTRLMTITVDGDPYTAEVSSAKISFADSDSDFITFADAAAGGKKDASFVFTAAQDLSADSLWTKILANSGSTVPVVLAPYGGALPTPTNPQVQFDAVIAKPDGDFLGGDANISPTARMTYESSWTLPDGFGPSNIKTA